MKKSTLFATIALFVGMLSVSAAELAKGTINKAIPEGWEYITNDEKYPNPSFYGDGGLKMNYEGQGILSPTFAAEGNVDVTITINALNQNEKTATSEDVFTFTALNAEGAEVGTATLKAVTVGDNTVTVEGTGIAQIKVIMTGYPHNGTKYCNVNLGAVTVNGEGEGAVTPDPEPTDAIFSETFATGQGDFTIYDVKNTKPEGETHSVWYYNSDYKQMAAGAFVSGANYETESWLISPAIDLSNVTKAVFSFDHAGKQFGAPVTNLTVQISSNYTEGDVTAATWTELAIPNHLEGETNDFKSAGDMDITAFCGQSAVRIAFKYTSTTSGAGNWYVKNVTVKNSEPGTGVANVSGNEASFFVSGGELIVNNVAEGTMVEIYNALGAKVQATVFDGSAINVSNLTNGVYVVRAGNNVQKMMF